MVCTSAPLEDVHVVVTGSGSHALGVVACVSSVFASASVPCLCPRRCFGAGHDHAVTPRGMATLRGGECHGAHPPSMSFARYFWILEKGDY